MTTRIDLGERVRSAPGFGPLRHLGFAMIGLVLWQAGPAAAQTAAEAPAAAPPLPTINYPFHDPDTAPPDRGPQASAPPPELAIASAPYYQYVQVGGVWGYWGRDRQFHHGRPGLAVRGAAYPRAVVHLPNASSGRIVSAPSMPHDRGPRR